MTACDEDLGPQVYLLDTARGLVIRESSLQQTAHVYVTLYCPYDFESAETSIKISESQTLTPRLSPSSPQSQLQLTSPSSSLPPLQPWVDPASGSSTSTESSQVISDSPQAESLPPIQMESRFSSVPKSASNAKFEFLSSLPVSLPSRWKENESHPSAWMKPTNYPSLVKRLSGSLPEAPILLANRTPSWLKRPMKGPSSPWLKLRSSSGAPKRRSLSISRPHTLSRFYENDYPWSDYEDDTMSLHWLDEHAGDDGWWPDAANTGINGLHRPKNLPSHRWKQDESPESSLPERTSALPIRHPPNYPSPTHKEDPPLLSEFKDKPSPLIPISKIPGSKLPKLLLLLQEPDHTDHPVSRQKCTSAHSVEDTEPWWPNYPQTDDGIPWQPEYPSDYSADDGDTWPMGRHTHEDTWARHVPIHNDQEEHFNHPQFHQKQTSSNPPSDQLGCAQCPPANYMDYGNQLKVRISPKEMHPPEQYSFKGPAMFTERPILSSTVRNSVKWKKSKPVPSRPVAPSRPPAQSHSFEPDPPTSASPWGFLSRLLLSHPTFRESTHVIRI